MPLRTGEPFRPASYVRRLPVINEVNLQTHTGCRMITWVLIWSAVTALVLVVLVQGKWTSRDSWYVAVFALAVMAMVIDYYVNQLVLR